MPACVVIWKKCCGRLVIRWSTWNSTTCKESGDIVNKLTHATSVTYFDPTDDVLKRQLEESVKHLENSPELHCTPNPNFYLSLEEVKDFFHKKSKNTFADFYRWQRERFNVLIDSKTYKPLGGKLVFSNDKSHKVAKDHGLPSFQVYGANDFVGEARNYVQKHFPDNPGETDGFPWPTNHAEAHAWLEAFVNGRMSEFGKYQEALDAAAPWLYHSAISPLLNTGLLSPVDVVGMAQKAAQEQTGNIDQVEPFVRGVLGMREYVRSLYIDHHAALRSEDVFGSRGITNDWYYGATGLPPVDDAISKLLQRGYIHDNERQLLLAAAYMSGIKASDVYRWMMELCIDAYDWSTVPNVYRQPVFTDYRELDLALFDSKFIMSVSHYERGDWSDVWDGLYWQAVENPQR